jgi:hypothetical protein
MKPVEVWIQAVRDDPSDSSKKIILITVENRHWDAVTVRKVTLYWKDGTSGSVAVERDVEPDGELTFGVSVPASFLREGAILGVSVTLEQEELLLL